VRRSYWLARAPWPSGQAAPPLLVALHGAGMDGRAMAWFTGLARRGPAAGITTVFPDGWKGAWHSSRAPASVPELDDARFLAELTTHLEGLGAARSWPVFLAGISQGARYAEHVARNGLLPVTGLFLVAGTALESSRRLMPLPQLRASMILVVGTDDPAAPYAGGQLARRGLSGQLSKWRGVKHGELPGEDIVAGAEEIVADWAAGNGITVSGISATGTIARPRIEELPLAPGAFPVTRTAWTKPGCHPATLYRMARRPAVHAGTGDRPRREAPGRDGPATRDGRTGNGDRPRLPRPGAEREITGKRTVQPSSGTCGPRAGISPVAPSHAARRRSVAAGRRGVSDAMRPFARIRAPDKVAVFTVRRAEPRLGGHGGSSPRGTTGSLLWPPAVRPGGAGRTAGP
jgi:poly(3-hydroxybutyrate) depolymerase